MSKLPREGRCVVTSEASVDDVWRVVADVTRTGEWSHETGQVDWLDGADGPAPGVRFRGRNQVRRLRWSRTCEVLAVEPGRSLTWRTVPTLLYPDSTEWTIEVAPLDDGGSQIEQRFRVVKLPAFFDHLYWRLVPAHRDRSDALRGDLERLAAIPAGAVPAS
jgi:hypothetical protein